MDQSPSNTLAERVERLERENRRLKRVGAALGIGAALFFAVGAGGAKVIDAERIVLSKDGTERAVLETDKEGSALLRFLDKKGNERLSLSVGDFGPSLDMRSSNGEDEVKLAIAAGAPQFHLSSPGKMVALVTHGGKDGAAELVVYDDDIVAGDGSAERVALRAQGGTASLSFFPAKDKAAQSLSLGTNKDGSMNVLLEDWQAEGKSSERIVLGGGPKGEAVLRVQNKEGKTLFEVPKR